MTTTGIKKPTATEISEGLDQAAALADDGRLDDALTMVQGLQAALQAADLASAHVEVALSALWSERGEMERALIHADEAMRLEPENPGCRVAFDAVIEKSNAVLLAAWPFDERGLLLFKVLVTSGLASKNLIALVMGTVEPGEPKPRSDLDAA